MCGNRSNTVTFLYLLKKNVVDALRSALQRLSMENSEICLSGYFQYLELCSQMNLFKV